MSFLIRQLFTISRFIRNNKSFRISAFNTNAVSGNVWKLGKLNHIAIAVPSLDEAIQFYKEILGAYVSEIVPIPEHGVSTVFINLGNTKLELLHPLGEKSPIESFLKKKPEGGMHHICIEVHNIKQAIISLSGKVRTLTKEPKIGAHNKLVIFLHPKDCGGVLIELEQE
ncbi:hypothetical protein LOD99_14361 [Oopsacas minuta]|uniref:Methylmalonyl-CoA epimerase, mitochondrial n=1 Tax=Oopsacas minuta TaxID=111878 RepID=A0AAV7KGM1_9METZ|nr:hypothetical protein LOD99_14361 [Oopsacas minuta]